MSIKHIVKMGNQQLATPSLAIKDPTKPDADIQYLIKDMQDTMLELGGVGIAAPQIGCNKRVVMFGFENSDRYPQAEAIPFTVLINPEIKILSPELVEGWEGCLSVPGLRGLVPRYNQIEYSGYDPEGNFIRRSVTGFHARVLQHECDHLDGILYVERLKSIRMFGFEDELAKIVR